MPRKNNSRSADSTTDEGWGFVNNYAHVAVLIAGNPQILQRVIADRVGITERAVQRIVADLEKSGYLVRQRAGRSNQYEIQHHRKLCDQGCGHVSLGDFIKLLQE